MLLFSLIIFIASIVGMGILIIRAFPRLIHVAVVQHKKFSLFGIENIHILEYKAPSEVLRKKILIFFEKILRRTRGLILKIDTILSNAIEVVQQKNQTSTLSGVREEHPLPVATPDILPQIPGIHNLIIVKEKPKALLRRRRIVQDIISKPQKTELTGNDHNDTKNVSF